MNILDSRLQIRSPLLWGVTQHWLVASCRRWGRHIGLIFKGLAWPFQGGPLYCRLTSITNYLTTLRIITREGRPQQLRSLDVCEALTLPGHPNIGIWNSFQKNNVNVLRVLTPSHLGSWGFILMYEAAWRIKMVPTYIGNITFSYSGVKIFRTL